MVKMQLEKAAKHLAQAQNAEASSIRQTIERISAVPSNTGLLDKLNGEWMKKQRESLNEKSESMRQRIEQSTFLTQIRGWKRCFASKSPQRNSIASFKSTGHRVSHSGTDRKAGLLNPVLQV